jgi:hypothetical protein
MSTVWSATTLVNTPSKKAQIWPIDFAPLTTKQKYAIARHVQAGLQASRQQPVQQQTIGVMDAAGGDEWPQINLVANTVLPEVQTLTRNCLQVSCDEEVIGQYASNRIWFV